MKIITKQYDTQNDIGEYFPNTPLENILFFDIETTGFSSQYNYIYLIGAASVDNNKIMLTQFFAEHPDEEKELLQQFLQYIELYSLFVNFNGEGFDIPFIQQRLSKYNLYESKINKENSFDILSWIKANKKTFNLIDYKLKTIERYLGIYREDLYSGGELIKQYYQYIKSKDPALEYNLLLHNGEDVYYMVIICKILKLTPRTKNQQLLNFSDYNVVWSDSSLQLNIHLPQSERNSFVFATEHTKISWDIQNRLFTLEAKPFLEELYYFFTNYKDYYYVPSLDEALHRSVAKYLDYPDKVLAKASNCYKKSHGYFISNILPSHSIPLFKKDYKSKDYYIKLETLTNTNTLDEEWLQNIAAELLFCF